MEYNTEDSGSDYPTSIVIDSIGNVYVAGMVWSDSTWSADFAVVKYDNDGNQVWESRHDGASNSAADIAFDLTIDNEGNVYAVGILEMIEVLTDDGELAVIKYSKNATGINEYQLTGNVKHIIYPNPMANSATILLNDNLFSVPIMINLYNQLGKKVKTVNLTNPTTTIHKDNLASGIYFYQLIQNNAPIGQGKLIIQ